MNTSSNVHLWSVVFFFFYRLIFGIKNTTVHVPALLSMNSLRDPSEGLNTRSHWLHSLKSSSRGQDSRQAKAWNLEISPRRPTASQPPSALWNTACEQLRKTPFLWVLKPELLKAEQTVAFCLPELTVFGKQRCLVINWALACSRQTPLTLHQISQHVKSAIAQVTTVPDPVVGPECWLNQGKLRKATELFLNASLSNTA